VTQRPPDLDDQALLALDSEDVLGAVEGFAHQCRTAWEIGTSATALPSGEGVDSIAVLGMGGSGVSGDVTQTVLEPRLPLPIRVVKTYGPLPRWVDTNTLVFAVSYSGSTEETVAAMDEARVRGARLVAISSGGPLQERAAQHGIAHVPIPAGLQPRASLPYLALPILAVLEKLGLVPELSPDVEETISVIEDLAKRCHRSVPASENPAKDLARRLHDKITIAYGGGAVAATAAMRFKCDVNEYGKAPAFWNEFPELNHNEIVGWTGLKDLTKQHMVLVLLRDPDEHPRVSLRFEITRRLVEDSFAEVVEVHSEGVSALARLMSLVFVTQLATIYLGLANGVDPGPVEIIQQLKRELADS